MQSIRDVLVKPKKPSIHKKCCFHSKCNSSKFITMGTGDMMHNAKRNNYDIFITMAE